MNSLTDLAQLGPPFEALGPDSPARPSHYIVQQDDPDAPWIEQRISLMDAAEREELENQIALVESPLEMRLHLAEGEGRCATACYC